MPRRKSDRPKKNPWKDALYGTYEGPRGSADEWRAAFGESMSPEQAQDILGHDSPWHILSIRRGASFDEIKKAWRKFVVLNHPDRFAKHGQEAMNAANVRFLQGKAAYVTLGGRE